MSETQRLEEEARRAAENAHAPYSGLRVGAAIRCADGSLWAGCNVENASYGLTICAERVAAAAAVAAGRSAFERIVIVTSAPTPVPPCGACRQVLSEFAEDMEIISVAPDGKRATWRLLELLPHAFRFEGGKTSV